MWEIQRIRNELNKLVNCNYEQLEQILRPLQFFTKFNTNTRIKLLQCAKFVKVKKNECVFKQGDTAGYLFVILYGSIAVMKTVDTDQGKQESLVLCLYDGQHFGELSSFFFSFYLMGIAIYGSKNIKQSAIDDIQYLKTVKDAKEFMQKEKQKEIEQEKLKDILLLRKLKNLENDDQQQQQQEQEKDCHYYYDQIPNFQLIEFQAKRTATCRALEDSYFLQLPQSEFKKVMTEFAQKEEDKKLKILINLRMFKGFEPFSLIPISNVLVPRKYSYGEVILKEGENMSSLFFICSGRVRLVKKQLESRSKFPSKCISHLQKPPNHFNCGIINYDKGNTKKNKKQNKFESAKEKNSQNLDNYTIVWTGKNKHERLYSFSKPESKKSSNNNNTTQKDQNTFYNIIEYQNIGIGDIFGGRGFYDKNVENQISKLTFLADSFECEIYVLEQFNLQYVPDYLQKLLIEGLMQIPDYDNVNTSIKNKRNLQWIHCKQKIYQEELKQIANPAAKQLIRYKQF